MASDDFVYNGDKLEEVFWTSFPEYRHVDCHRLTVPLSWLGLDADLQQVLFFLRCLTDGYIELVGYWRWRSPILLIIHWNMQFHHLTYLLNILDLSCGILIKVHYARIRVY